MIWQNDHHALWHALVVLVGVTLLLALVFAVRLKAALRPYREKDASEKKLDGTGSESSSTLGTTLNSRKASTPNSDKDVFSQCATTIFLGSGGHTAEMLQLVSGLDPKKYSPRHYVVGMDDLVSIEKVHQLESARGQIDITHQFNIQGKKVVDQEQSEGYTIHRIPRSRFVHQSILTTPFTLIKSLLVAMPLIQRLTCYTRTPLTKSNSGKGATPFKTNGQSILLLNGPGTCFALALTVIGARMLGVPIDQTAAIVFVESFARVQTLSLTGKLLYPIADVFLVQWDELCQKYPRSNYLGMLV